MTGDEAEHFASLLGPAWEYSPGDEEHVNVFAYCGPDSTLAGAGVTCAPGQAETRTWYATRQMPDGTYLHEFLTSEKLRTALCRKILVSMSKSREVLAAEVQRRLIAPYLPAYAAAVKNYVAAQPQIAADNALATELAALCGTTPRTLRGPEHDEAIVWSGKPTAAHPLRLCIQAGKVRLEGCILTPEQARHVLALIQSWQP
jgi:hypothetical protein